MNRHQLGEPTLQVVERWHAFEAAGGEWRSVEAFGRRVPVELAVEPVVVVVGREMGEPIGGCVKRPEDLAVEELRLEDPPEALDLAVRPGRVHLGPQVPDAQLLERLAEQRQDTRHPDDERRAVVAHQLERRPAQLEAVIEPGEDWHGPRLRQDAQADEEAAVIVNETDDPDLLVLGPAAAQEERALDVDVPELVRTTPLIGRPAFPSGRRASGAESG